MDRKQFVAARLSAAGIVLSDDELNQLATTYARSDVEETHATH